jgi:dihydrofolate synthase / folylpolyglutamate synthase
MSDDDPADDTAARARATAGNEPTYAEVERALLSRWPETRLDPSLERIQALVDLLGDPQRAYRAVHLTGTNGKTSTSRMIDALLRGAGLRTGRFTSPHLESMTERISVDGEPVAEEAFVRAWLDVAPYVDMVDRQGPHPMSFFETSVAMAYAAFADAPVDVAVVEVGMGGAWDATNVVDAEVAVLTPISVDHARYLGETPVAIAEEKVGIIKPNSVVVAAHQDEEEVMEVIVRRAREVGAELRVEGVHFGVVQSVPAVGGQLMSLRVDETSFDDVFLPLYGGHQAQNAVLALAAVHAVLGQGALTGQVVEAAFGEVTAPGRLEVIRRGPTILLDAAHNPHGAAATVEAVREFFTFDPLVGVVAVMADKDVEGLLAELEPALSEIVCTQTTTSRCLPAEELAEVARDLFGEHRVRVVPRLDDAIEAGVTLAETGGPTGASIGAGGVLVTGSVITAGQARTLLRRKVPGRA